MATALHTDCVVCRTNADKLSGSEATMTLLRMMRWNDTTLDQIVRDLCFAHRRIVDGNAVFDMPATAGKLMPLVGTSPSRKDVQRFAVSLPYDMSRWSEQQEEKFFPIAPNSCAVFTWRPQLHTQVERLICDEMAQEDLEACFVTSIVVGCTEQVIGPPMLLAMFVSEAGAVLHGMNVQIGQDFRVQIENRSEREVQFKMRVEGIEGAL